MVIWSWCRHCRQIPASFSGQSQKFNYCAETAVASVTSFLKEFYEWRNEWGKNIVFSACAACEYKNRFLSVLSINLRLPESRGCYTSVFVRLDECKMRLCYFLARNFEVPFHCRRVDSQILARYNFVTTIANFSRPNWGDLLRYTGTARRRD